MAHKFSRLTIEITGALLLLFGVLAIVGGCALLEDLFNLSPGEPNVTDIVKVVDTDDAGLHVRDAPAGEVIRTVPDGWVLQITGGPKAAILNKETHNWWQIEAGKFGDFPSNGWVADKFLRKATGVILVPAALPDYYKNVSNQIEAAIGRATSAARATENWANLCLGFVAKAFTGSTYTGWGCPEEGVDYSCPMGGVEKLTAEGNFYPVSNCWNPPRGALVFFSGQGTCNGLNMATHGHIGIYLGNGQVVHAYGSVRTQDINDIIRLEYIDSYIGWACPPSEWCTVLFSDDFNDGLDPAWASTSPLWRVENARYQFFPDDVWSMTQIGYSFVLVGRDWQDYSIEGDIWHGGDGNLGLIFRAQDDLKSMVIAWGDTDGLWWEVIENGETILVSDKVSPGLFAGSPQHIKVEATETIYRFYVRNVLRSTFEDSHFQTGMPGVAASHYWIFQWGPREHVGIDNFKVTLQ